MQTVDQTITKLFLSLFKPWELQTFAATLECPEGLEHTIPWQAPFEHVCFEFSVALRNRRRIDAAFFRRLLLARPNAVAEIQAVAHIIGLAPLDLALTACLDVPRVEYRAMSFTQLYGGLARTALLSSWARPTHAVMISAIFACVLLAFTVGGERLGAVVLLVSLVASVLALLGYLLAAWLTTRRLWNQAGISPSDIEVLLCTQDGLEIRSRTRASITPYSLITLVHGIREWRVELGASTFEYFPHQNLVSRPAEKFWRDLHARIESHSQAHSTYPASSPPQPPGGSTV